MKSPVNPPAQSDTTAMAKEVEALNDVASAFMQSQVLLVANDLDLFTRLDEGSMAADEVARDLGTDRRATRMLLDALVGLKYLEKRDGLYSNADVAKRFLVRGSPVYQGDSLRHRYHQWFSWSALGEVMKSGVPPESPAAEYTKSEEQKTRDFILAMDNSGRMRAEQLAEQLPLAGTQLLLDLGGGPGTYACVFARRHPRLRAVVYDLPDVCAIAEEQISKAGLAQRVTTRAGDFLVDELGEGYDLIFVSNVVHIYSLPQIRQMLLKCFEALNPGGRIAIKDFFLDEDRSGPLFSLLFAINMLVSTKAGDTYTFGQIEGELAGAGFTSLERIPFTGQSWLIIGERKRGDS
jgi:predicted O-methyltransferase YrrM